MHIVPELSDDWGVLTGTGDGKVVRICFRRPEAQDSRCSRKP
ncbi:hypothetical protein ACGFWI_05295 [Streptomyces sp. NPDC048434]